MFVGREQKGYCMIYFSNSTGTFYGDGRAALNVTLHTQNHVFVDLLPTIILGVVVVLYFVYVRFHP
jgi:hypothetical protein